MFESPLSGWTGSPVADTKRAKLQTANDGKAAAGWRCQGKPAAIKDSAVERPGVVKGAPQGAAKRTLDDEDRSTTRQRQAAG